MHLSARAQLSKLENLIERPDERSYLFKELWTPEEASRFVGRQWSAETIRRYASNGKIPCRKQGQLVMIPRDEFVEEIGENYDRLADTNSKTPASAPANGE